MGSHTSDLWQLAFELLDYSTLQRLRAVATARPFNLRALLDLDRRIGGPGIHNVNDTNDGCYRGADQAIFRPLQTCRALFQADTLSLALLARDIVRAAALHLDTLVRQASGRWASRLPLGQSLRHEMLKDRLDPLTRDQLVRFTTLCNDARPLVLHYGTSADLTIEDAVLAYVVARKLAEAIWHMLTRQARFAPARPHAALVA